MLTIQVKLIFDKQEDAEILKSLMQRYSACMHTYYNQMTDELNHDKTILKKNDQELQNKFNLNSWYVRSAIIEAEALFKAQVELKQNPGKVIFGSKKLFRKLKKRHLSIKQRELIKQKYQETRKYNLYSIGEARLDGNRNTKIYGKQLKINVGFHQYIYAEIKTRDKRWYDLLQSDKYTTKVIIRNNEIYCNFSFEQAMPEGEINFSNGVIGIDLNASPSNIAWAEINQEGNYINSDTIGTPELYDCSTNKRNYYVFHYAHQIVKLAKEKNKGVVLEDLHLGNINRVISNFCRSKLAVAIEITAKRAGIKCIKIHPAYTSIIGCVKYSPIYNLSRHESAALVIGRKGLGYKENMPKCYKEFNEYKSFACKVNKANVTQKKKKVGVDFSKKKSSLLNKVFSDVYNVCRIAVLTEQFTAPFGKKLPNWSVLKKFVLDGEDSRFKKLVPLSSCGAVLNSILKKEQT